MTSFECNDCDKDTYFEDIEEGLCPSCYRKMDRRREEVRREVERQLAEERARPVNKKC